ncbi:hypothetical protein BpHYR1_007979 [Brachionus plicatilis]|uniref:Uncharacterized protein n=1 Tax=Brachionus plicatilis TaxID=10195 RepID=A0A3M7QF58_BRAPC|nr:hypothetical protein BpHYR1_007979 [Brachionus plicatilis]
MQMIDERMHIWMKMGILFLGFLSNFKPNVIGIVPSSFGAVKHYVNHCATNPYISLMFILLDN